MSLHLYAMETITIGYYLTSVAGVTLPTVRPENVPLFGVFSYLLLLIVQWSLDKNLVALMKMYKAAQRISV